MVSCRFSRHVVRTSSAACVRLPSLGLGMFVPAIVLLGSRCRCDVVTVGRRTPVIDPFLARSRVASAVSWRIIDEAPIVFLDVRLCRLVEGGVALRFLATSTPRSNSLRASYRLASLTFASRLLSLVYKTVVCATACSHTLCKPPRYCRPAPAFLGARGSYGRHPPTTTPQHLVFFICFLHRKKNR